MKTIEYIKLADVIRGAIEELRENGESVATSTLVEYLFEQHADQLSAHLDQLAREGLYQRCRQTVKRCSPENESLTPEQISLDLGLPMPQLAYQYAVPIDKANLLGNKEWIATPDLTVEDAELAAAALDAQILNDSAQVKELRSLITQVVKVIGHGSDLTVGDAARLARERKEQS